MIITVEEYKTLADLKCDGKDLQIEALIPEIEADYLLIRNKPFDGDEYPPGSKLVAAEMLSYKLQSLESNVGTSSEKIGGYSHSYDSSRTRGYPSYIVKKIRSFARAL